jgi:hypothetical protein
VSDINPRKYDSVQQYLAALEFKIIGEFFVKGNITFPISEIMNHTPATFAEKARRRGWFDEPVCSPPLSSWKKQGLSFGDEN